MPKKNNTPRPRLTRDVYSTIERVAEITGNPDAFPEAADLITDILLKMSSRTQVWIDHPDIIRAFLLTVDRLGTDDAVTHFSELREACHFAGSGAAIKDLRARLRYRDIHDDDDRQETPGVVGDPPPNVVHLGAWLDSHPRPIRNLLFAEKE